MTLYDQTNMIFGASRVGLKMTLSEPPEVNNLLILFYILMLKESSSL